LVAKEAEAAELLVRMDKLTKVGELFRALMDQLVTKQVRVIEGVVTEGLSTIFHDLDLGFEADLGTKYNKVSVDFLFRQGQKDDPLAIRGKPLDAFGGGPSAVADLILRMLAVLRLKKKPLLLLDETLASVSDEYVNATGHFLQQLAKSMGLDVLLVTHKHTFLDHADKSYRCSEVTTEDGSRHLELRST
jgi:ABC-type iron transport system FetAB ATPase subunit